MRAPLAHRRDAGGYTLTELLLALAIAGVIVIPLMAWALLVVAQQDDIQNDLGRANSTGFLNSYLSRDVASSKFVKAGGSACGGGAVGSQPELQLVPAGVDRRVVYVEAPASDPDAVITTSLWRTECGADGALADSVEVVRGIRAGSSTVGCFGAAGAGDCAEDANRQVEMSVVPVRVDGRDAPTIELRVLRRTSAASTGSPAQSNRHPVAQLTISPPTGYGSTSFRLSAGESFDVDGSIASYDWSLPAGSACTASDGGAAQECRFPVVGDHLIQVTVTDDGGATNASTGTVTVLNQFPVAVASVSPASGSVGSTVFAFDASGSADPDGGSLTYQWDLGEDMGPARFLAGPTPTFTFPSGAPGGLRQVTLVITDANGDTDAAVVVVNLDGGQPGGPGGGTQIGDVSISPSLVNTGSGLPRLPDAVGPGLPSRTATFTSTVPPAPDATSAWELRRRGGAVVATGTGTSFVHTFGPSDGGEYEVVVTVTPAGGAPVASAPAAFRVNAAPTASFSWTGTQDVAFDSSASGDAEGAIVSYRWDFGYLGRWTSSNPSPSWTFTGGNYQVTLEVMDADGATARVTRSLLVPGQPAMPTDLGWQGSVLTWTAVPGVDSYSVSLIQPCGNQTFTVPAGPAPSFQAALPSTACGAPGTVDAYVQARSNGIDGPFGGPARTSG